MTNLDDAMIAHMAFIVFSLCRPFCRLDFMLFEHEGKEYKVAPGTFRNKISNLVKSGEVELAYKSVIAFYTLRGHRFDKPMTFTHLGGKSNLSNDPFVRMIQNLPMDKNALHDIRLRFEVKDIWTYLYTYHPELLVRNNSKDIMIPTWNIEGLLVRVTVHRTDTVSVAIGCSVATIAADVNGIIRLSSALVRVEERLNELLKNANVGKEDARTGGYCVTADAVSGKFGQRQALQVPEHRQWIVTMWHFGADSLVEYAGDKFSVTWEIGQHALIRAYTKIIRDRKIRIRLERQEYPKKTFPEALEEKLNLGGFNFP
jgi:hypothetical protein